MDFKGVIRICLCCCRKKRTTRIEETNNGRDLTKLEVGRMRKLTNVLYTRATRLTEEMKDELMIPNEYKGKVAVETWEVNGELKRKGVCVHKVVDYMLGFGEFKDVPIIEEDKYDYNKDLTYQ